MDKQLVRVMTVVSALNIGNAFGAGPTWPAFLVMFVLGLFLYVLWPLMIGVIIGFGIYGFIGMFQTGDRGVTLLISFLIGIVVLYTLF